MATATVGIDFEHLEPFGRFRKEVANIYDDFLATAQEHFDWLDEIYDEARETFQKNDIQLLPTTPSERRKRGRRKNGGGVQKRQSSAVKRHTGSGRFSRIRLDVQKAELAIAAVVGDQGASTSESAEELEEPGASPTIVITKKGNADHDQVDMAVDQPVAEENWAGENVIIEMIENNAAVNETFVFEMVEETDDSDQKTEKTADVGEQANIRSEKNAETKEVVEIPAEEQQEAVAVFSEQLTAKVGSLVVKAETTVTTSESQHLFKPEGQKDFSTPATERKLYLGLASGTSKSHLPVPISASRERLTPSILTPRSTPTHPMKPSIRTPQTSEIKKENINEVRSRLNERLEDAEAKKREFLQHRIELAKQKREEQQKRVNQKRLLQQAKEEELKRKIEQKYSTPAGADLDEKRKLRPKYVESGTKRTDNERTQMQERENERAKEAERIQREQREMERLAQLERERQKLPPVSHSAVKQGDLKTVMSGHQHQSTTKPKYLETFEPSKDTSIARPVIPKLSRGALNVSNAGASAVPATVTKQNVSVAPEPESYDMTPLRNMRPATDTNYDISDLRSSDETDDEEHPRKQVPAWAKGANLRLALTTQFYQPIDLDALFGIAGMPDLSQIFKFKRKRFEKRTSSAKWDSPIRPHGAE